MKTDTICRDLSCEQGIAERPRYYARQLITSDDLTLEQEYFRNKLRAHNRLMHGWGVVCGAQVCPNPAPNAGAGYNPWEVLVSPGYILSPYGDEVVIPRPRVVDLRTSGISGTSNASGVDTLDPWCSDVYVPRSLNGPLYIAVRYKECQGRPVRVMPSGCSCDDNRCEYSRVQDGYEISVLDHCPETNIEQLDRNNIPDYLQKIGLITANDGRRAQCPTCPEEPWVVLARVNVDADGTITEIDNCDCRRIVISFGAYALRCQIERPTVDGLLDPAHLTAGDTNKTLVIKGTNFKPGMKVNLGPGITVDYANARLDTNPPRYTVRISIDESAPVGKRPITLVNPDCATATFPNKFEVDPRPAPGQALGQEPQPSGGSQPSARPAGQAGTKKRPEATKSRAPKT